MRLKILAVAALALALTSCALVERADTAKLIVQVATLRAIESGAEPATRALEIIGIAQGAMAYAQGDTTLDAVEQAVRAEIDWQSLSVSDRVLANYLIETVGQEMRARIGKGVIPPDKIVAVRTVLEWVIDAARMLA